MEQKVELKIQDVQRRARHKREEEKKIELMRTKIQDVHRRARHEREEEGPRGRVGWAGLP